MLKNSPSKFNNTISYLRENYLLPREFALQVYQRVKQCKLPEGFTYSKEYLENYALRLGKKELEDCLVCLLHENRPEVTSAILETLQIRMSTRLIDLIWALTQYFYELPNMRKAARLAASSLICRDVVLKTLFQEERNYIEAGVDVIRQNNQNIAQVLSENNLIVDSPLWCIIMRHFFLQGNEQSFLMNENYFMNLLDASSEEEILPILINYLNQPWSFYISRKINRKILELYGLPEDHISSIWSKLSPDLIRKFKQWIFLDILEDFFGAESRKNSVLSKYHKEIVHISFFDEDNIMMINFGSFGILNIRDIQGYSWLMNNETMNMAVESLSKGEEIPWIKTRMNVDARDVIIEEMSSDILILNMAGIGKLYVEELMTELLRKGQGMWTVRFKQAIARFKMNFS